MGRAITDTDDSGVAQVQFMPGKSLYEIKFVPLSISNVDFMGSEKLGEGGLLLDNYQQENNTDNRYIYLEDGIFVTNYSQTIDETVISGTFEEKPVFYKNKENLTKELI
ncbi:MAG: hypothetical protein ACOC1X_02845 [Promethearchaeota archaeon]